MDRKIPDNTFPRAALGQLLDKFPTYKLQSQEEAETAIRIIEKILSYCHIRGRGQGQLTSLMHP